jgi:FG-GAP-like repeat
LKPLIAVAGALLLVGSAYAVSGSTAAAPSFAAPMQYATSVLSAQSVAIGDLDGDGSQDIVASHAYAGDEDPGLLKTSAVSVLLNRGAGRFGRAIAYPTGDSGDRRGAWAVAIGDLNGDGHTDLATANPGGKSVSVLSNRGDGSFAPPVNYALGREPWDIAVADLNADGKIDVATANPNTVSVLLNRGDGTLEDPHEYSTGHLSDNQAVAVGDLNGDGRPDLVTVPYRRSVATVLLNRGDGFEAFEDYPTGPGPLSVAIGDLDGDSKPDLVSVNGTTTPNGTIFDSVSVLHGRGDGTFAPKRDYSKRECGASFTFCTQLAFSSVLIADLNGDRKPDVAAATYGETDFFARAKTRSVSVFLNRGDGRLRPRVDYGPVAKNNGYGRAIASGDLNGDSRPDLVTPRWRSVSVLMSKPGLCTVQDVREVALAAARRAIVRGNCRVGRVRHKYWGYVRPGHVLAERPGPGSVVPAHTRVDLVVSRGSKP